jgi:hypothetical protein
MTMETLEERVAFDMYFASISSMQLHPGAGTKDHHQLTLEECRDMALRMFELRKSVMSGQEN